MKFKIKIILFIILSLSCNMVFANTRDGLIGFWKLDETSGTSSFDSSSSGNTGTLTNSPALSTNTPRTNGRSFLSASSQYITMGDIAAYDFTGATTFSIAFWGKQNAVASEIWVSKQIANGNSNGWFIATTTATGTVRFVGRETSSTSVDCFSTAAPFANTNWHHIVITFSGGRNVASVVFYVDGVLSATNSTTDSSVASWTNTASFNIAARNGTNVFLNGSMDDVRVYNRVLTAQEVKDLYTPGIRLFYAPGT